jgi:hypothetical protein
MAKKRTYRRYFGRKRRHSGPKKIPVLPIIGVLAAPGIYNAGLRTLAGDFPGAWSWLRNVVGIDNSNNFNMTMAFQNWTPILAGILAHKAASMLGVNRAIRKLPYVNL